MKAIKEYKHSIKFECKKCGNHVTTKKGSQCALSGKCGRCIER